MTYVKNISNWPDRGGQIMDMVYGFDHSRVIFLEKLETAKLDKYASKCLCFINFDQKHVTLA